MTKARPKSRHLRRLAPGVVATFVAATAMAFSNGGGQHPHAQGTGQDDPHTASSGAGGSHGGGAAPETQQSPTGDGGSGGGSGELSQLGATGSGQGPYGPGDGADDVVGGFIPNGEDGLMRLADFAARQADGGSSDNVNQGGQSGPADGGIGGDAGAEADSGLTGPGDPALPSDPNDDQTDKPGSSLFGFLAGGGGGGGGGGGFGGGGGGGAGGGSGPGGTAPTTGGPTGEDPRVGPITDPTTDPITVPDAPGGCIATHSCLTPPTGDGGPTPPLTFIPQVDAIPVVGPDITVVPTPAPEPAAWVMMILGFGAAGSVLRARRKALA